jgi:hypothetical protein
LVDRDHRPDLRDQGIVRPAIEIRLLRHENDVAADPARFIDHHDVLHAARLRLARTRDDAGAPATGIGDHANWPPPQARVAQLLDGSEESIKIKVKVFNRRWFSHGLQPDRVSHK